MNNECFGSKYLWYLFIFSYLQPDWRSSEHSSYPTIEYCHLPFEEHTVHPEHECQSSQSWHHSCVTHFAESKACIYSMIEMAFWHFPVFCWIISIVKKMHWISSVIALFRSAFALDWTVIVSQEKGNVPFGWWGGKNTILSTFPSLIFSNFHLYKFPLYCSAFICRW